MTNIDGIKLLHVDVNFCQPDVTNACLNVGALRFDHRPSGRSYTADSTRAIQPLNDDNKNVVRYLFDEDQPDRETFTDCTFDLTAADLFDKRTFVELWIDNDPVYEEYVDVYNITLSVEDKDGKIHEIPVN